jgi:hypothetical protein
MCEEEYRHKDYSQLISYQSDFEISNEGSRSGDIRGLLDYSSIISGNLLCQKLVLQCIYPEICLSEIIPREKYKCIDIST